MVYMIVLEYWFGDIIGWGDIGELALNSRSGSYPPLKNGGGLRPVDPPESGGNGIRSPLSWGAPGVMSMKYPQQRSERDIVWIFQAPARV